MGTSPGNRQNSAIAIRQSITSAGQVCGFCHPSADRGAHRLKTWHAPFMVLVGALATGLSFGQAGVVAETVGDSPIGAPGGVNVQHRVINARFTKRSGHQQQLERGMIDSEHANSLLGRQPLQAASQWTRRILWSDRFGLSGWSHPHLDQNGLVAVLAAHGTMHHQVSFAKNAFQSEFSRISQEKTEGWQFRSDIGLAYQGQINLTTAGDNIPSRLGFLDSIQAEPASLLNPLSRYRWSPAVQVSMDYRF